MPTFDEVIEEAAALVRRAAHPKRGTIALSPEVAGLLAAVGGRTSADPRAAQLEALAKEAAGCTRCSLAATRTQVVFGDGHPGAQVVFVGEAPGYHEDCQGKPFVGAAGQLLTDIIEKGMKLRRADVYICNVLRCRPPENRDPLPEEAEACEPFLARQLEIIGPRVICALGAHAARSLLKMEASISTLRGDWHAYRGIPVRVTYHPAYLLRNPADKRKTWEDIQHVMRLLRGEEAPGAGDEARDAGTSDGA